MRGTVEGTETAFALPAATVTFLMSDIEGSTRLWETHPEAMTRAVPMHYAVLTDSVARYGGVRPVEQGEGDSIVAAFSRASDAVAAALDAQRALAAQPWPDGVRVRVRLALQTAEAQLLDAGNYFGAALNRCARLRAIGNGGQTLLTRGVHDLVVDRLPSGAELVDLGSHRLRDLGRPEQVFALRHPDLPAGDEPLRSLDALPNNLPEHLTSFVGRERELEELARALRATRMLTLTGAGGCGKTRLAAQLAADALDRFPDGVWWIELAPLADPAAVGPALGDAIGVKPLPGQTSLQAAVAHLANASVLVVLDNCEHLLEACAQTAEALLRGVHAVTVVATSRAPLGGGRGDHLARAVAVAAARALGRAGRRDRPIRRGSAVHRAGTEGTPEFRGQCVQCTGDRADLPRPRRDPAGDRACRGAGTRARRRADRGGARRPLPPADRRGPLGDAPSADAARVGRLESRAARRGRTSAVPAPCDIRRRLDARRRRGCLLGRGP
jgi:class 3 adenylate cyclase